MVQCWSSRRKHVLSGVHERRRLRARAVQLLLPAATLLDAQTDSQLWSREFDRELDDIFAIQGEIATAIAERLRVTLVGGDVSRRGPADVEAYDLYLQGRAAYRRRRTVEDVDAALDFYQRAVTADPTYALAHAGLAEAWSVRPSYSRGEHAEDVARAEVAAQTAVSLDGALPQAHLALERSGIVEIFHLHVPDTTTNGSPHQGALLHRGNCFRIRTGRSVGRSLNRCG